MKRIIALCAALLWLGGANAYAQDADHAWGTPGGAIVNGAIGMCLNSAGLAIPTGPLCVGGTPVSVPTTDPCGSSGVAKSSAPISIATATTTQLVAVSGTTAIYVCGFSMSIAPSAVSADSAQFEYGTSTNCTGTHALTGTFGSGDLTSAAPPLGISYGGGGQAIFSAPASNGLCLVTAGTAVNVQGVLTYVQM